MITKVSGDEFILVEAESLSLEDEFMRWYHPHNQRGIEAKALISNAIRLGVKNFYCPKCDPSFTADGKGICFAPGNKPAVGKSFNWWEAVAKSFCPERNSRLGTKLEYGAFLGVLIKKLIESGQGIFQAWDIVCINSKELGHYRNSENAKEGQEPTGSRCICGFCDLANAYKFLTQGTQSSCFNVASGDYRDFSFGHPIADIWEFEDCREEDDDYGVGWIVLS